MADPYIGEVRVFTFNFAPVGWLSCDGTLYPIQQYQALFAIVGTLYGGDGRTTFGVPNLKGDAICGVGLAPQGGTVNRQQGVQYGETSVTLTQAQMPAHTHQLVRQGGGWTYNKKLSGPTANAALGGMLESTGAVATLTSTGAPNLALAPQTISAYGAGGAHENRQPLQVFNICIAYEGVFPSPP